MIEFALNGEMVQTTDDADTPVLWVVRDTFGLKGSKYGCGVAQCGACTMHVEGEAVRACVLPVGAVAGKAVTTIEGLSRAERLHPLQQAWIDRNVPQCGYCQTGQIMSAAALLAANPKPSRDEVAQVMSGNLCRCGCYPRILQAILDVAERLPAPRQRA